MKKLLGLLVAVFAAVGLSGGLAAANSGTIEETGPDSHNEIKYENESNVDLDNNTTVSANINANQDAESGDAKVWGNTTGGDAESGDADNENEVEATLEIDNSGSSSAALSCACQNGGGGSDGSIENTGPDSWNKIKFNDTNNVTVSNNTTVSFTSNTNQSASTGDAWVKHNTTGGDATTGSASNSSSSSFSLSVTN